MGWTSGMNRSEGRADAHTFSRFRRAYLRGSRSLVEPAEVVVGVIAGSIAREPASARPGDAPCLSDTDCTHLAPMLPTDRAARRFSGWGDGSTR